MNNEMGFSVHCGNSNDGLDRLKSICEKEAECLQIDLSVGETIKIPFWTSDIPELICIGSFGKNDDCEMGYELDFSQNTL